VPVKRPSFQFYPADWRKDVELQSCSMAAQGLWINAMCLAHECEPYGHLTINGKAMTPAQLGRQVGLSAKESESLLIELLDAGVARKTEEGVIYSSRMVRDERLRNVRAESGRLGGNPNLLKQKDNQEVNQPSKQSTTPSSSSSSSPSGEIPDPTGLVASADAEAPPAQVVKLEPRRIPCPAEQLLEAFHTECPTLPRVMKLNDKRRTHLTARWREVDADSKFQNSEDGIEVFRGIFRKVNASDFLAGRAKAWHATFDWLTESSTNFLKVCEGHYDNDRRAAK
jgi:hypothetical protein